MIRHFVIDTHGELGDLVPLELFFCELADKELFGLFGEWNLTDKDTSLDDLKDLIFKNLLMKPGSTYSLIFLLNIPDRECGDHPLSGCLVDQLYRIKAEILEPLKEHHVSPVKTWVIVFDQLPRNDITGEPNSDKARVRWQFDLKGYISSDTSMPGILHESEINSLPFNDTTRLTEELEKLMNKKIDKTADFHGEIPLFLKGDKLQKLWEDFTDKIKNRISEASGHEQPITLDYIKTLLKTSFSIYSYDLQCFNIIRFSPATQAFQRVERNLVELAQLILFLMSSESSTTLNTETHGIWEVENININPERFGALITCYRYFLSKLEEKLDNMTREMSRINFKVLSDKGCMCQGNIEPFEVESPSFDRLLNREDPEIWEKKVDEWEKNLDDRHENACSQVQDCYHKTRTFVPRAENLEASLDEYIRSCESEISNNREKLFKQFNHLPHLDTEEWRKNERYYKINVIELLDARPTRFHIFLCISFALILIASTWLYPINYSGSYLYYSGFVIFAVLPLIAILTSLQTLVNKIKKAMDKVTGEIHRFSKKIVEGFNTRMDLVINLCKNGILHDNLQTANLKSREIAQKYNLTMHQKGIIKEILTPIVANLEKTFNMTDPHIPCEQLSSTNLDDFDWKKPFNKNPFYSIIYSERVKETGQILAQMSGDNPEYEEDFLYILDGINFRRNQV